MKSLKQLLTEYLNAKHPHGFNMEVVRDEIIQTSAALNCDVSVATFYRYLKRTEFGELPVGFLKAITIVTGYSLPKELLAV